ncbi:MAG: hypothetical protein KF718_19390 [Polyangiaceae bacterium]|nr:hypothetical protein [Polyangiaceae bacterium]
MRSNWALVVTLLALADVAVAQSKPRGPDPRDLTDSMLGPYVRPPYEEAEGEAERAEYEGKASGRRHHGGFYLRLAGGVGYGSDSVESDASAFDDVVTGQPTAFSGTASGFAAATEIAIGFTPVRGLVIGAGVYTATLIESSASGVATATGKYEFNVSQLALFMPMVDFYLDPQSGLHFQGGVGLGTFVMGQAYPTGPGPDARAHTGIGPGFMLGVGYEWFVSDEWSMGLAARVLYAATSGSDPESVDWTHRSFAPTMMVTVTYH